MSKNLKFYEVYGNVFVHMNEDNKHGVIKFLNDLYPGVKWYSGDSLTTDPKSLYGYSVNSTNDRDHSLLVRIHFNNEDNVFLLGDPFEVYLETKEMEESNLDAFLVPHKRFAKRNFSLKVGDRVAIDEFDEDLVPHYYIHEIQGTGVVIEVDTDGTYRVDVEYDNEWVHKLFLTKVEDEVEDEVEDDVVDEIIRVGDRVFVEEFDEDLIEQELEHYATGVGTVLEVDFDGTYLVDLPTDIQWVHERFITKLLRREVPNQEVTYKVGEKVNINPLDPGVNIRPRHFAYGTATIQSVEENRCEVVFDGGLVQTVNNHYIEKIEGVK